MTTTCTVQAFFRASEAKKLWQGPGDPARYSCSLRPGHGGDWHIAHARNDPTQPAIVKWPASRDDSPWLAKRDAAVAALAALTPERLQFKYAEAMIAHGEALMARLDNPGAHSAAQERATEDALERVTDALLLQALAKLDGGMSS